MWSYSRRLWMRMDESRTLCDSAGACCGIGCVDRCREGSTHAQPLLTTFLQPLQHVYIPDNGSPLTVVKAMQCNNALSVSVALQTVLWWWLFAIQTMFVVVLRGSVAPSVSSLRGLFVPSSVTSQFCRSLATAAGPKTVRPLQHAWQAIFSLAACLYDAV
jgi:hypothetical protein